MKVFILCMVCMSKIIVNPAKNSSRGISRVPAGSVYKMAHCLGKGLGLGLGWPFYVTRTLNFGTGTLDTALYN